MTTHGLLLKIYHASEGLKKFGKHPMTQKIRTDLEVKIAEAEEELTRRGYTKTDETTYAKD